MYAIITIDFLSVTRQKKFRISRFHPKIRILRENPLGFLREFSQTDQRTQDLRVFHAFERIFPIFPTYSENTFSSSSRYELLVFLEVFLSV